MANPWIEHVKQKAKELNVSYGCAITLPEVKKTYKPKAKPSKPTKPQRKTEQKRMAMEDVDAPPPKPVAKKTVAKKAVVKKTVVKKKSPATKGKPQRKTEQKRMAMEDVDAPPAKSKSVLQMYDSDTDSLIKFNDFPEEQAERQKKPAKKAVKKAPVAKKTVAKKAVVKKKSPATKGKPLSLKEEHSKFKKSIAELLPDQKPFEIFAIANDEKLQDASDELIDDMGQTFDIQVTAENYADDEIIEPHEIIKMISDYLDPKGKYADQIDKDVKQGFEKLSPDDKLKLIIITVNNLIFSGELTDAKAIRSIYYPSLSKYVLKSLKATAKKYNKKELYI